MAGCGGGFSIMPKPGVWMKYVKYVFGVVIIIVGLYYAYTGIVIYTSLAESHKNIEKSMDSLVSALKESAKTKRLVFIDFRAEWCKNCKAMEKTTFKDPAVQNELKNFMECSVLFLQVLCVQVNSLQGKLQRL